MATLICGMWEPKHRKISQPKEVSSKKFDLRLAEATWNSWCSTLIQVLKSKKYIFHDTNFLLKKETISLKKNLIEGLDFCFLVLCMKDKWSIKKKISSQIPI